MTDPLDREPWDQWSDETPDQHRGFLAYRDLPAYQRSMRNSTAVELGYPIPYDPATVTAAQRRKHGTVQRHREKWSSEHQWVQRALAWDEHRSRMRAAEQRDSIREMQARHAAIGQTLIGIALETIEKARAGEPDTSILAGAPHATIRAIVEGCRIERAAYGLETLLLDVDAPQVEERAAPLRELLGRSPAVAGAAADTLLAMRRADREAKAAAK